MVRFTPPAAKPMNDAVIETIYRYTLKGLSLHRLAQG
jgi:hypothetical protein